MDNLKKYTKDLDKLMNDGVRLQLGFLKLLGKLDEVPDKEEVIQQYPPLDFNLNYETWYSESLSLIKQLLPNRLNDFSALYKLSSRKDIDYITYTISDHLLGLVTRRGGSVIADSSSAYQKFIGQMAIMNSIKARFKSSLFDISQLVQADLFDDEIISAQELNQKGFMRASGVICGVVIEKHLKAVCLNHNVKLTKKNPTLNEYFDLLKSNDVIDLIQFRNLQSLADIRNLACHFKEREPTKDEINDLILGTSKVIKTIY